MGRDAASEASQNVKTGQQYSGNLMTGSQDLSKTLVPALTQQAQNGIDPATLNAMRTGTEQAVGGANAGAAGQGALTEARTRNAGAANPAIEESARNAMRQQSQNEMGIQTMNYGAKQAGLQGLQGLYGTDLNAALNALGLSTNAVNAQTAADQQTLSSWMQPLQAGLNFLAPAAKGCWVAAELYGGWYEPRTIAVRGWINQRPAILAIYMRIGEWWANVIRRNDPLRIVTKAVFDWILRQTNYGR